MVVVVVGGGGGGDVEDDDGEGCMAKDLNHNNNRCNNILIALRQKKIRRHVFLTVTLELTVKK